MNIFKISIFAGIFILVILASGGCMSTSRGKVITGEQLMSLEVGKTTLKELKVLWGQPWQETVLPNGNMTAIWMWSKSKITPVPFIGSKSRVRSGNQILFFNKDGVLNRIP